MKYVNKLTYVHGLFGNFNLVGKYSKKLFCYWLIVKIVNK